MAPEKSPNSLSQEFPAWHQFQQFYDVGVFQFVGPYEDIKTSRAMLDRLYPQQEKAIVGIDATWLCSSHGYEIYSLIVLVKGIL